MPTRSRTTSAWWRSSPAFRPTGGRGTRRQSSSRAWTLHVPPALRPRRGAAGARTAVRFTRADVSMNGYLAAAVAVVIWAAYPVATRAAVIGSFSPQELVTLRFGIAALLFVPYLA